MSLLARIAKKIRRRLRPKGFLRGLMNRPNRNWRGVTAEELWRRTYQFKETQPARAGTRRRIARELKARNTG